MKKLTDPIWNMDQKRWIKSVRVNGKVKKVYSSTPGARGKAECKRKVQALLEDREDKFNWPVDRCFELFLADVARRLGKDSETYIQHDKHGRL